MNPQEYLRDILKGNPIPDDIWESPELLWEAVDNKTHSDRWTLLQAVLFARKLDDVPEHIDLLGHTHPETGDTLLHSAIRWGLPQEVTHLLKLGANPLQQNNAGETPAMLGDAATNASIKIVMNRHLEQLTRARVLRAIKPNIPPLQL